PSPPTPFCRPAFGTERSRPSPFVPEHRQRCDLQRYQKTKPFPVPIGNKGHERSQRSRLYIGGNVGTVPAPNTGNSRVESTRERVEHMAEPTPRKRGRRSARQAGSRFEIGRASCRESAYGAE